MSFLGRHIAVDHSLLKDFRVDFQKKGGGVLIKSRGSIMESAKVFDSVRVRPAQSELLVTVYASLAFWNKSGSPDFSASVELALEPGRYDAWYKSPRAPPVFLGAIDV